MRDTYFSSLEGEKNHWVETLQFVTKKNRHSNSEAGLSEELLSYMESSWNF